MEWFSPYTNDGFLDSSKLKEFADDNFRFDKNCRAFTKKKHGFKKTLREKEKLLMISNFSFSHSVFKRLVLQTSKNKSLSGKRLKT